MAKFNVKCYTDGGCSPNPGIGGWGVLLLCDEIGFRKEFSGGFEQTTNNRMELFAAIKALQLLNSDSVESVELFSDSAYVVNAFKKKWIESWKATNWKHGTVLNVDLWQQLIPLAEKYKVKFTWIKAHNGHPMNERADELSKRGRTETLETDHQYVQTKNSQINLAI